jgi:hypothetical protein
MRTHCTLVVVENRDVVSAHDEGNRARRDVYRGVFTGEA